MQRTSITFLFLSLLSISGLYAGVRTLPTQSKTIYDISFTAHGSALAVADGQSVKIFSFPDAQLLREFSGSHQSQIMSIALSPDSTLLVSGDRDGRIVIWNMKTGQEIHQIQSHDGIVLSLDISPDGRYIVSGGTDHKVQLYDLQQKEVAHNFFRHTLDVTVVRFHPGGSAFFSGSGDSRVIYYAMDDLNIPRVIGNHNGWVRHLAISPDGNLLTSVGDDRRVRKWSIAEQGNFRSRGEIKLLSGWNTSVDYFSDNNTIAVSSINGRIRIQAPISRMSFNLRRPVHRILLKPTDDTTLIAVVATRGKGVMIIPATEMSLKR